MFAAIGAMDAAFHRLERVRRLHRRYGGKREVRIYDCADLNVPMLSGMFDRRCRGY